MIKKLCEPLSKDDVELRVGTVGKTGLSLLLYKTARTDVKRLNDVCGTKWRNKHFYDNQGLLCCSIEIYDSEIKEWVGREDVGTESNTEKEKGHYSDSFKRAGFKWGIGIELYNSPFIFLQWETKPKANGKNGFDSVGFFPTNLNILNYKVENGEPKVTIEYKGKGVVFDNFGNTKISQKVEKKEPIKNDNLVDDIKEINELLELTRSDLMQYLNHFKVSAISELTVQQIAQIKTSLKKKLGATNE